ncbi:hypothetical protein [Parabacteroides sp.]
MKQIKRFLLAALLLVVAGNMILQAQSVSTVTLKGTTYPVIDLTALSPLGIILTKSQADARRAAMYDSKITPSLTDSIKGNGINGEWNKALSGRFQLMKANHTVGNVDWVTAWNSCKTYDGSADGGVSQAGQWRLPTIGELMMIQLLHPQLQKQGLITSHIPDNCCSSTEESPTHVYRIGMGNMNIRNNNNLKKVTAAFRCIRDL